ncbi:MAG TPA: dTDP-4-dehydrorhamnose reductase, partial [Terriglobales bacterium]
DRAESEPELAQAINATAPGIIAQEAERCAALFIHYSTDYVFSGQKSAPYVEEDATGPINVYGRSKLTGEEAVRQRCPHHLIFRTSWVFSARGQNFVRTMLRLGREREQISVVADQQGVPTSAAALASATWGTIAVWRNASGERRRELSGTYHAVGGPATNWHAFAEEAFRQADRARMSMQVKNVAAITTAEYPTPATRPRNSVLSSTRLRERFGIEVRDWREELKDVVVQIRDLQQAPIQSE